MARSIVVQIIGDAKHFKKTTEDAAEHGGKFGLSMAKVAAGGALVAGALAAGGAAVFSLGSKFEAADAKAQTVFGDSIPLVQDWAKESAAAMGLTQREATGLAANLGDLLIPMGFTRDAAAAMSTDIVGLSGALAEWSGGTKTSAEVAEVLQKALLGERDGLKALGISITEADVKAQLMADGTDKLTGAALEQAKAMATQRLIMAKTTDAQDAYAKGTSKGLRTQAEMNAALGEVGETIITGLYPAVSTIAGFLADNLPGAIQFAKDAFAGIQSVIEPIASVAIPILMEGFAVVGDVVRKLEPIFSRVFGVISTVVKALAPVVSAVFGVIGDVIRDTVNGIGVVFGILETAIGTIGDVFGGLGDIVRNVFGTISGIVKAAINGVISIVNSIIGAINSIQVHIEVGPVKYDFDGLNIPRIPTLHQGGIVPGAPGSEVLAKLQAGERVIPADGGGAGQVININIASFIGSDDDIDRFSEKVALRLRTLGA